MTVGAIRGVRQRAGVARAKSELAALATALGEFKRRYGDYPQLGGFDQAPLAPAGKDDGPGLATVQAKLFNCLSGVFGPTAFSASDRIRGPNLLDPGRFSISGTPADHSVAPGNDVPNPAVRREQDAALLDPWGRRYLYYYKDARNPAKWQAAGYILYSAGAAIAANGQQTAPLMPDTGLFTAAPTPDMADNIYANP